LQIPSAFLPGSRLFYEFLRFLFRDADSFANYFDLFSRKRALLPIPSVSFPGSRLFYELLPAFFPEGGCFENSIGFFSGALTLLRIPSSFPPGRGLSCKFLQVIFQEGLFLANFPSFFPGTWLFCKFLSYNPVTLDNDIERQKKLEADAVRDGLFRYAQSYEYHLARIPSRSAIC